MDKTNGVTNIANKKLLNVVWSFQMWINASYQEEAERDSM